MGSQRIASSLINRPYHPPGWGEPAPGEEPGEGEDGYTNPPLEDGYSELSDGVIVDMQATLRELFDNPDLEMNPESLHLQSLGEPIEFNCSPGSGAEYEGGEGGEGGPGESEYIDPLCACEQSLYWATEAGYDCQTLNVIYFYHPDYLGSVEYVTDMRGEPYQFFLNTPWGENLENQFAKNYTSFSSRFRFNGKEWDEETGNFYYGARYYDPKISVWLSVDRLAAKYPNLSPYNFTANNPLNLLDPNGDSLRVNDSEGNFLFMLDDGSEDITDITAVDLYDQGTQWFEPDADNYMPLIRTAKNLSQSDRLKHFSWQDIADFATQDRYMVSYRTGGSGDWKSVKEGADGFYLVTVGGEPYWADAIGQIPFAVNLVNDYLGEGMNMKDAISKTLSTGQEYAEGGLFSNTEDNSNSYDNHMILRGAIWGAINNHYSRNMNSSRLKPSYLGKPVSGNEAKMYGL